MIELNHVYNQDCLEGMKNIPDKSIDMILCDLPYGTTACKWDVIIPFEPLWKQYERIIKDNGAIVLTASQPFTSALVMSNPKLFRYEWIWEKNKAQGFMNAKKMPLKTVENICVFYKSLPNYFPQVIIRIDRIIKNTGTKNKTSDKANGDKSSANNAIKNIFYKQEFENYPTQLLKYSNAFNNQLHPTQKPVALFEYLIKTYTNESETVLDNCMGSGTTAIACINTNRNYIGFEKEEKYYNIIQERIKKHAPQLKLIA